MKKAIHSKQPIGTLGEYKSIWMGVDDPLESELIARELRKNHRRPMKQIRRIVAVKYWFQIVRWTLEDMRVYAPLFGAVVLGILLLLIAVS
ncbi:MULTISPECIES: hypothetical protein [unclassified Paenibacillus]|uniref:Uncharacterized protein n=1 Tax=Paenibacillus provencensis TaxID=441151 RepID=A0ABW3PYB6_9BACL|nr:MULTISPECIES: hypothetical protein [unclassified Paenibacillus]MCM3130190.1 hypothetical protein [Paenibacillus sp. MER 78]SDX71376.1 hypothetical protein SAMN05518848_11282 [Paenibacillus sp. PDC88]SFS88686.1 hypothetical protein SAMN04488601_10678 [Paenibacillus sp. 453mf]